LGIDLVPFKTCSYDCVYCQLGRTTIKTVERKEYVPIDDVMAEVERKLAAANRPDYIGLAGSGEPTLNSRIGELINRLRRLTDIPIAVLTNGSLLWMEEVRDALMGADLVLPSLDAGNERLFRYVNRPHPEISFDRMVEGLAAFAGSYPKEIWLEVFLLEGVTGIPAEAEKIASHISRIRPARVQLNTVTRPAAEEFALPLSAARMLALRNLFPGEVEIIGEGLPDGTRVPIPSKAMGADILALLGRRPCTSADVAAGLGIHITEALKLLERLIGAGTVKTLRADGRRYYTRAAFEGAPWPLRRQRRTKDDPYLKKMKRIEPIMID